MVDAWPQTEEMAEHAELEVEVVAVFTPSAVEENLAALQLAEQLIERGQQELGQEKLSEVPHAAAVQGLLVPEAPHTVQSPQVPEVPHVVQGPQVPDGQNPAIHVLLHVHLNQLCGEGERLQKGSKRRTTDKEALKTYTSLVYNLQFR